MAERNPNETWRIFIAIEIPAPVRTQMQDHVRRLREAVPQAQASWTRPENVHLTLKFLGDTAPSRIAELSDAVSRAVQTLGTFTVRVAGTGVFPNHRAPKVLWIGLTDDGHLHQLQTQLEVECKQKGFPREERAFHPHLTVARLRKPQQARALALAHEQMEFMSIEFMVGEVLVIRSELSSQGSRYTTLSRHPLAG